MSARHPKKSHLGTDYAWEIPAKRSSRRARGEESDQSEVSSSSKSNTPQQTKRRRIDDNK